MSYELKIDPKRRVAGRFIGAVRKALISAALKEKQDHGLTQQKVAECLGVNRSVVNRMLRGDENLTLRSIAELAWAMGWEPHFTLRKLDTAHMSNELQTKAPYHHAYPSSAPRSASPVKGTYNVGATTTNRYQVTAE